MKLMGETLSSMQTDQGGKIAWPPRSDGSAGGGRRGQAHNLTGVVAEYPASADQVTAPLTIAVSTPTEWRM